MRSFTGLLFFLFIYSASFGQDVKEKIRQLNNELSKVEAQKKLLLDKLEDLKLEEIRYELEAAGLPQVKPGEELIKHSAYYLSFAPKYKQARWVAHIVTPDVVNGLVFRTNDFRVDSLVKAGSAVEEDYFLKSYKADSTIVYDGFGYDRGHLAPSADFRWSQKALSESYFYSNMSPQLADFNRGAWGDLEDAIRGYLFRNPSSRIYILTGPVFEDNLPLIQRGKNKLPIPKRFWKVALDIKNKKAIGFVMPNQAITQPLQSFAVSVNEVEALAGLDFFNRFPAVLQDSLESQRDPAAWLPQASSTDAEPLDQQSLPRNHFNTSVAKDWAGRSEAITVCGTVVGARISRAGNILLNLDKQFPNQVFTVFIRKEDIVNFNYKPEEALKGKIICVKGRVIDLGGTPAMYIENENDLKTR